MAAGEPPPGAETLPGAETPPAAEAPPGETWEEAGARAARKSCAERGLACFDPDDL